MLQAENADQYTNRALQLVDSRKAPPPITKDPSWFKCRFCEFRAQCHYDEPLDNECCRSCVYASAEHHGKWKCNLHGCEIPKDKQGAKCPKYEACL